MRPSLPVLGLVCALALAQDAAAPQITTEQKLDYRRAQVNLLSAQAAFNGVVETLRRMCGSHELVIDERGDPGCKAAPPPAAMPSTDRSMPMPPPVSH